MEEDGVSGENKGVGIIAAIDDPIHPVDLAFLDVSSREGKVREGTSRSTNGNGRGIDTDDTVVGKKCSHVSTLKRGVGHLWGQPEAAPKF